VQKWLKSVYIYESYCKIKTTRYTLFALLEQEMYCA